MATLTLAPFGLAVARNFQASAPNYQFNIYFIERGYASAIGFGDLVITGTGSTHFGAVQIYAAAGTHSLGVFAGCLPYFDTTLQQVVNKQWYAGTEQPGVGGVVQCMVIDDPFAVFTLQVGGGTTYNPITRLQRGGNIDLAQNGSPNTSTGMSTAYADAATYNDTTATLPLRVLGPSERMFAGYNPTKQSTFGSPPTNNYIDVRLNTSENMTATGI